MGAKKKGAKKAPKAFEVDFVPLTDGFEGQTEAQNAMTKFWKYAQHGILEKREEKLLPEIDKVNEL